MRYYRCVTSSSHLRALRRRRDELLERKSLRLVHLAWLLLAGFVGGAAVGGSLAASVDGDPLFGLAGDLVCPTTCDGCTGPLVKGDLRIVEDRRGTGTFFKYSCQLHEGGKARTVRVDNGLAMFVIFSVTAAATILLCALVMTISLVVWNLKWKTFVASHPNLDSEVS